MSSFSFVHSKRDFNVKSFGSGANVKLPGPAPDRPNIYSFTTTYDEMYKDLLRKDSQLYPAFNFPSFGNSKATESERNCSEKAGRKEKFR